MAQARQLAELGRFLAGLCLIPLIVFSGCTGDGAGLGENGDPAMPGQGTVSFSGEVQPIFNDHCIACHAPGGIGYLATGGANGGLDLTAGASHGALVGVRTYEEPQTAPRWRVLAGEPDSSYVVQKIASTSPKQGSQMPLGGPYLSDGQVQLIEQWIDEGAIDN